MARGILFAVLYGFLVWIAGGILVSLLVPLIATGNAQQIGGLASLAVLVLLAIPAAVYGFVKNRRS